MPRTRPRADASVKSDSTAMPRRHGGFFVSSRRSGGQRARRQDRRRSADEPNLARRGPPCPRRKSNETSAVASDKESVSMPRTRPRAAASVRSDSTAMPRRHGGFFVSSRRSGGQRARREDRRRSADEPNLARRGPPLSRDSTSAKTVAWSKVTIAVASDKESVWMPRTRPRADASVKSDSTAMPRRHGSFFVSSRRSGGQRARPLGDGNPVVNQKLRRTLRP